MPPLKNTRQETFCQEWVKDHNDSRAYKAAGYKCGTYNAAHAGPNILLKKVNIRKRIMEIERPMLEAKRRAEVKAAEASIIDRAWVVGRLVSNVDRSMQAEAVCDKDGNPTGVYKYEGNVANRGLELIGKNLGMFQEQNPLEGLFAGANISINMYLPAKETHDRSNGHTTIDGNGHTEA